MENFIQKYDIQPLKIFKIDEDYSLEELNKSYKKLSLKYHPDKKSGSVQKFQIINKCYKFLLTEIEGRISLDIVKKKIHNNINSKEEYFRNVSYNKVGKEEEQFNTFIEKREENYNHKDIDFSKKYVDDIVPEKIEIKDFNKTFEYLKSKNNQLIKSDKFIGSPKGIESDVGAPICCFNNDIIEDEIQVDDMNDLFWKYTPKKEDIDIEEIESFNQKNKKDFKDIKDIKIYRENIEYSGEVYDDKLFEQRYYESIVDNMKISKDKIKKYKKQHRINY